MKLRNKKTDEIVDIADLDFTSDNFAIWLSTTKYSSLAELNEEWEDYEEPKGYYVVTGFGSTIEFVETDLTSRLGYKEIGNYFETKEEAEKAVEKLKAWKRLKDKGFRFIDHTDFDDGNITIWGKFNKELDEQDVNLLFGGEE